MVRVAVYWLRWSWHATTDRVAPGIRLSFTNERAYRRDHRECASRAHVRRHGSINATWWHTVGSPEVCIDDGRQVVQHNALDLTLSSIQRVIAVYFAALIADLLISGSSCVHLGGGHAVFDVHAELFLGAGSAMAARTLIAHWIIVASDYVRSEGGAVWIGKESAVGASPRNGGHFALFFESSHGSVRWQQSEDRDSLLTYT